jgi:DNA-binding transcriptional MerR regulator
MTLILRGRRFGFGLEEIRQWLDVYESHGTEAQMQMLVERADEQLARLAMERDELDIAIADLRKLRDEVADSLRTPQSAQRPP